MNQTGRTLGRAALVAAILTTLAPTPPAHADRDALWNLVNGQCVPDQLTVGDPAPCTVVDLSQGEARGYAVLKDMNGAQQYLLIPTARVTGTDDPALQYPWTPNYLALAWDARRFTEERVGSPIPRDRMSLAVNATTSRSQDQLHIHIDCLRPDVHEALTGYADRIGPTWAPLPMLLGDHFYDAMALTTEQFTTLNPFAVAAQGVADPRVLAMGVVGAGTDAEPRFILLRHLDDPAHGDLAGAENLQDHERCVTG